MSDFVLRFALALAKGAVYITAGMTFFGLLGRCVQLYGVAGPQIAFIGMILLWVGGVTVHEAGHLFGALAGRLRIVSVAVGPIQVMRKKRGFRLGRHPDRPTDAAGFVMVQPTVLDRLGRRLAWCLCGGPLANLLTGLLCLALAVHFNQPASEGHLGGSSLWPWEWILDSTTSWACWLYTAAIVNLLLGLNNLIPIPIDGKGNDGVKLMALFRGKHSWQRIAPILEHYEILRTLNQAMRGGVRPRDWDAGLVEKMLPPEEMSSPGLEFSLSSFYLYGYFHALDTGNYDRAGQLLDLALRHRKGNSINFRAAVCMEGTFFEAFYRHDLSAARAWWVRAQCGLVEAPTWLRAEAAILLAEGQRVEAADKAEKGLAALADSTDLGGALAERELLEAILAEARKPASDAPGATSGEV